MGVETVVRDDPSLTVRRVPLRPEQRQPIRVVLDRRYEQKRQKTGVLCGACGMSSGRVPSSQPSHHHHPSSSSSQPPPLFFHYPACASPTTRRCSTTVSAPSSTTCRARECLYCFSSSFRLCKALLEDTNEANPSTLSHTHPYKHTHHHHPNTHTNSWRHMRAADIMLQKFGAPVLIDCIYEPQLSPGDAAPLREILGRLYDMGASCVSYF